MNHFALSWLKALILVAYHQIEAWNFARTWIFHPDDSVGMWEGKWEVEEGKMYPAGGIKQFLDLFLLTAFPWDQWLGFTVLASTWLTHDQSGSAITMPGCCVINGV